MSPMAIFNTIRNTLAALVFRGRSPAALADHTTQSRGYFVRQKAVGDRLRARASDINTRPLERAELARDDPRGLRIETEMLLPLRQKLHRLFRLERLGMRDGQNV